MIALVAGGLAGAALLAVASEHLVRGAARLSAALRVAPAVVAAVVIGFGTSTPELALGGIAAGQGRLDLAVGNIVGSNLANVSLVLGLAAVVAVIHVDTDLLRGQALVSTAAVVLFGALLVLGGGLGRAEGVGLLAVLAAALVWMVRRARSEPPDELGREVQEFVDGAPLRGGREALRVAAGLAGTLVGAQLVVWAATGIASDLGLAEGFVGVTVVAVGTSLPELVTAVQAGRRGEHDLIVGNVLGSNLFNSLGVAGLAAVIGPGEVVDRTLIQVGVPVMVVAALLGWALMARGRRVTRGEGVILLVGYAACLPLLG
ncbi:MAG: calcium/sodium antiporter [Acidimicrobiales bacterium]|nr:calcium/sodium antiporter [Acidimicrobiales bacterium]